MMCKLFIDLNKQAQLKVFYKIIRRMDKQQSKTLYIRIKVVRRSKQMISQNDQNGQQSFVQTNNHSSQDKDISSSFSPSIQSQEAEENSETNSNLEEQKSFLKNKIHQKLNSRSAFSRNIAVSKIVVKSNYQRLEKLQEDKNEEKERKKLHKKLLALILCKEDKVNLDMFNQKYKIIDQHNIITQREYEHLLNSFCTDVVRVMEKFILIQYGKKVKHPTKFELPRLRKNIVRSREYLSRQSCSTLSQFLKFMFELDNYTLVQSQIISLYNDLTTEFQRKKKININILENSSIGNQKKSRKKRRKPLFYKEKIDNNWKDEHEKLLFQMLRECCSYDQTRKLFCLKYPENASIWTQQYLKAACLKYFKKAYRMLSNRIKKNKENKGKSALVPLSQKRSNVLFKQLVGLGVRIDLLNFYQQKQKFEGTKELIIKINDVLRTDFRREEELQRYEYKRMIQNNIL